MREVRMTFGEHLDELRRRVIAALVWLVGATIVCFTFHDPLLEVSMRPHRYAVRSAMSKRHLVNVERTVSQLGAVMGEAANWEALFADEIREQWADVHVGALFDRFAGEVTPLAPEESRPRIEAAILQLGSDLADSLTTLVSPETVPAEFRGLPERLVKLTGRLRDVASAYEPTKFQELLGLGVDLEKIFGPLEEFNRFLAERHRAIMETPPDIARLRAIVADAGIVARVSRLHDELLSSVEELERNQREKPEITVIKYTEAFMTSFKVALIFGILFALPLILYEMWKFIGAGLYEHEQRYVLIFFPFSIALFVCGVLFGFYWMVPIGLQFLAGWGAGFANLSFTLESYINLFFTLTIILGLVFQTPLVMLFLFKIELVSSEGFARARKYTLLGAVIFSTLVTPPDPLSW